MSRVALVTGGTRGIGAAIAMKLKEDGCTVAATFAGNEEKAAAFTAETGIKTYKWNVADYDACTAGIAQIVEDLGPVDILVNNAGHQSRRHRLHQGAGPRRRARWHHRQRGGPRLHQHRDDEHNS